MNQADTLIEQAMQLQLTGQLARAEALYRRAIKLQPRDARAHRLLGIALFKMGRYNDAVVALNKAQSLDPTHADGLIALGNANLQLERWKEAEAALRRSVELKPDFIPSLNNLASVVQRLGKHEEAEELCRRALALDENNPETLSNLSYVLHSLNRYEEAETYARKAVGIDPNHAQACNNLAVALSGLMRFEEAEIMCRKAIALKPDMWEAHLGLGNIMKATHNLPLTLEAARKAVELRPDKLISHDMLGLALLEADELEEAEACFRRASALDPQESAVYAHIASALRAQGLQDEAMAYSVKAVELKPDEEVSLFNLALDLLAVGRLMEGWERYEYRKALTGIAKRFHNTRWHGERVKDKTKTLLVHVEQGFGDTIQFARYLPLVKTRFAGRVLFECQRELLPLLRGLSGFDEIVPRPGDLAPTIVDYDYYVSLLSLPLIFETTLDNIPSASLPLDVPAERIERWRDRLSDSQGLKVGLRWAGNPIFVDDRRRSVHLEQLAPLAKVRGVQYFSLQTDGAAKQLANPPEGLEVVDLAPEIQDFQDTAALLIDLDLLISTDTSVPHLAGTLDCPTWMALPFVADWRWRMGPQDYSVWYPSIRMFRRHNRKEWSGVFEEIARELQQFADANAEG